MTNTNRRVRHPGLTAAVAATFTVNDMRYEAVLN